MSTTAEMMQYFSYKCKILCQLSDNNKYFFLISGHISFYTGVIVNFACRDDKKL